MSTMESVASPPASVHTRVDTNFGETAERRASQGLVAHAATVFPSVVRSRNQDRARMASGARIKMERSEPWIVTLPTFHVPPNALG